MYQFKRFANLVFTRPNPLKNMRQLRHKYNNKSKMGGEISFKTKLRSKAGFVPWAFHIVFIMTSYLIPSFGKTRAKPPVWGISQVLY
jgi:hypothetical protein